MMRREMAAGVGWVRGGGRGGCGVLVGGAVPPSRSRGVREGRRDACACLPCQCPTRQAYGWESRSVELDVDLLPQAAQDLALLAGVIAVSR